ncbi:hypothetical protein [Sunxiuqinia rutila]|uniref:hypothetical protein n=1 Tax=Sunxiuqinia rutila TaxID=1397841 RepID=UPI003D35E636
MSRKEPKNCDKEQEFDVKEQEKHGKEWLRRQKESESSDKEPKSDVKEYATGKKELRVSCFSQQPNVDRSADAVKFVNQARIDLSACKASDSVRKKRTEKWQKSSIRRSEYLITDNCEL